MAIRRPPTTFSDTISTADIADDAITTAKVADDQITGALLANDIAISTTGNIATTGSGTLTVAGNTTLSGTNNLGSNPTLTLGSNATFPAGIFIQAVTGTGANISGVTHNGGTFTTIETLSTTITVNKGNKVLIIATGVPWYTTGTTNHNGIVRLRLSDGTNEGVTNGCILLTQNFSINNKRMYGTGHTGIMTTASGSGTVVVTATVQASTESGATVNYGDTNTYSAFNYTLFEIQA